MPSQDDARPSRPVGRDELARDWAIKVSRTAYIPLSAAKLIEELHELLNVVAEALVEEPEVASLVGARLVEIHCVGWKINKKTGERKKPEQPEGWLENIQADLVVMPTEGRNGVFDALRGSATERVLRRLRCPLLAVLAVPAPRP